MAKDAPASDFHADEKDVISDSATDVDNEGHIDGTSTNSTHEKISDDTVKTAEAVEPEHVYISGFQLWLVMSSVTLVVFLMLLDVSIIVTVSLDVLNCQKIIDNRNRLFPELPATFTRCQMLGGMVVRIFSQGKSLYMVPMIYMSQLTYSTAAPFNL